MVPRAAVGPDLKEVDEERPHRQRTVAAKWGTNLAGQSPLFHSSPEYNAVERQDKKPEPEEDYYDEAERYRSPLLVCLMAPSEVHPLWG